jgi:phasin
MSQDQPQNPFESFKIPNEMRTFAEESVAQARKAFDGFIDAARSTAENFQKQAVSTSSGALDMSRKAMSFAEENVAASFDFAQKVVRAKDPAEVVQLQKDYLDRQMQALTEQARELGQRATEMTKDSIKSNT